MKIDALISNFKFWDDEDFKQSVISLPVNKEDIRKIFNEFCVDENISHVFITDLCLPVESIEELFKGEQDIDLLNEVTTKLENFSDDDYIKLAAICECECPATLSELQEIVEYFDDYTYIPGVYNDKDLSDYFIEDVKAEDLRAYVNPWWLGRDIRATLCADYTKHGCVLNTKC